MNDETCEKKDPLQTVVPIEFQGCRLDLALSQLFPQHSRGRLKQWIDQGYVTVNGQSKRPKDKMLGKEEVVIQPVFEPTIAFEPQQMPLDIVYEDDALMVINKPDNLVVHPAPGNPSGTLLNGLLYHCEQLNEVARAGIVHRLDKDTTGLMVVAKTPMAHTYLVEALQKREVSRVYETLVKGHPLPKGCVNTAIGRHPKDRKKMAVVPGPLGKPARTWFTRLAQFHEFAHCRVKLDTGRTHQIRVHMAHLKHPVIGDKTYGGRYHPSKNWPDNLSKQLLNFNRQALHAAQLSFHHPITQERMEFKSALPQDMRSLLSKLEEYAQN